MNLQPPVTLGELAARAEGGIRKKLTDLGAPDLPFEISVQGDPATRISALCPVESPEPGGLTFAVKKNYLETAENGPVAAVIVPPGLVPAALPHITAAEPRLVFTVLLELARPNPGPAPAEEGRVRFKDRTGVTLGRDVVIGDFCSVGAKVRIGDGVRIYPHVFIDDDVTIGDGCVLYPHVAVYRGSRLGRQVVLHTGVVIGDDGFGYNQYPDFERGRLYHLKNAHQGGVVLEDFVELGAQVCVDRGLVGDTVIGAGTKVDNLVQIAHNCKVGRDCIIVAQVGMAGHARFGDRVFALGQAGFTTGASVGDDAIIGAKAGVSGDIPAGRVMWTGVPAQKGDDEYKQVALARRELPRVREFFRLLKKAESLEDLKEAFFKPRETSGRKDK